MNVQVLGTGCPKCKSMARNVQEALANLEMVADVQKVTDLADIMEYDILITPGLVLNGKVVVAGRVPTVLETERLLTEAADKV